MQCIIYNIIYEVCIKWISQRGFLSISSFCPTTIHPNQMESDVLATFDKVLALIIQLLYTQIRAPAVRMSRNTRYSGAHVKKIGQRRSPLSMKDSG